MKESLNSEMMLKEIMSFQSTDDTDLSDLHGIKSVYIRSIRVICVPWQQRYLDGDRCY